MSKVRISPIGKLIEQREGGLYLAQGESLAEALLFVKREGLEVRETVRPIEITEPHQGQMVNVLVEIGYSDSIERDGVAEWGQGKTVEEAMRYALGAHFGSWEDPIWEGETR